MSEIHLEVLGKEAIRLLPILGKILGNRYYLAGGTALALQAGHRRSEDLDFFRLAEDGRLPGKERLKSGLRRLGKFVLEFEDEGTLHLAVHGVRVSLLAYRVPHLEPLVRAEGVGMAGPLDIGLMKLSAIIGRGTKRDFIDLAWIIREHYPLATLLKTLPRKFPEASAIVLIALKALVSFEQAEKSPDPVVLDPRYQWVPVRKFIVAEVKRIASQF